MPELPRISVIIVSLNGEAYLPTTVESVLACGYPDLELIVVDNGSGAAMKQATRQLPPRARLIELPENLGFAGGNNRGIAASTGDIIILLNDDTEVEPDWLDAILVRMTADPRIQIVGCKILDMDRQTLQHAGGMVSPHGLCFHRGHGEPDHGQYDEPRDVAYVTGAALAFRRSLLELIGTLEPSYFPLYFEETEFCHAAHQVGGRVVYEPAAVVYHHGMRTSTPFSQRYFFRYHRNRLRFLLRNRARQEWPRILVAELRWLASFQHGRQYGALALAYVSTIGHLPAILRGRRSHLRRLCSNRDRLLPISPGEKERTSQC